MLWRASQNDYRFVPSPWNIQDTVHATRIMAKNVFLIGPGYIGLTVLDNLLKDGYNVTALVRRQSAADELTKMGVKTVMGQLHDHAVISAQTAQSDVIIHTATADDMQSVQAVIDGIRQRVAQGTKTIYIHTSGTSFLSDDSKSEYSSETVYQDDKPEELDALPDSASHRLIDLEIIRARQEFGTQAKLFLMLPPLIYGVVKQHQKLSIQVPTLTRFALKHKYAGYVGKGKAIWSTVHVADLARAYMLVLRWAQTAPDSVATGNPYFFCENGEEISWGEIAAMIGQQLEPLGKVYVSSTKEIPEEIHGDLFGPYSTVVIGANSRSRARRVRELGWTPKELGIREAFEVEELPLLLSETGVFNGYGKPAASGASS
ncbi:related to Weak similarity to Y.pseudotuberculosis CDP-3,6-dideoxy-D-glycero-L-glycero-4-hexulose-5-epimerase [Ramularia collo-cygni]|uniref:Related to Weak similarity to Y.pseudotuberculosis CDP-3,6-dideoxy-D-glycero-L-glycero-4-hexulose-5-epimerase n=1 Tax=Ramularia collo-cygni TaxID=112498 RepID=A0A2D3UZM9_9PEZI|nr:related to Weak similarity to Y.pseudotuberculosis CDP-3,6-dideoxy-D-glycero-L-glycero-4-hexulose-5-epimerase [Ramularia collo-cygni]CZT14679.1 related to Weak similarity to Y.pseudotuberculosis CDP-3,6-dideoxy-D-glycero-L-glycero-4-hexulose-5-epimerase [Ramularia collo-cygni]